MKILEHRLSVIEKHLSLGSTAEQIAQAIAESDEQAGLYHYSYDGPVTFPDGTVLVPQEPTEKMIKAGNACDATTIAFAETHYRAMIEA